MSTQFDRRILVTGASDGIGGATCRKLAADAQAAGQSLAIAITTNDVALTSGRDPSPSLAIACWTISTAPNVIIAAITSETSVSYR